MGPRLFSRGNANGDTLAAVALARFNGGRGFSAAETLTPMPQTAWRCELQWGRGFSAAETRPCCANQRRRSALQWGRGFSAAETSTSHERAYRANACFNGAAAFQPRKRLQSVRCCQACAECFNGAAAFQPRKHLGNVTMYRSHWSFNGAAAFQPRKLETWRWRRRKSASFNGAAAFQPRKPSSGFPWPIRQ